MQLTEMHFLPELKQFLKTNRVIYTVRKYRMTKKEVEVEGVGVCTRVPLGKIDTPDQLEPYVGMSGFDSLSDWLLKIRRFIPPEGDWYLYRVGLKSKV